MEAISEEEQRRLDAFLMLTRLEMRLRGYLDRELSRARGPRWVSALPKDIREKLDGRGLEFSDFPDLRKIISSNWKQLPSQGGARKETILAHLQGLEPIRNAVAHSREIHSGDLSVVEAAYYVVGTFIGDQKQDTALSPTNHPSVALSRIKAAIQHHAAVDPVDLSVVKAQSELQDVADAIAGYARVRNRPGRSVPLLREVEHRALGAMAPYCETS